MTRLSDEHETRSRSRSASAGSRRAARQRYLRLRGHEGGCLAILGFEGENEDVERRRRAAGARCCAPAAAVALGTPPGGLGARPLRAPYLRDELLDRGVMVETLETATTWTKPAQRSTAPSPARCAARWRRAARRRS